MTWIDRIALLFVAVGMAVNLVYTGIIHEDVKELKERKDG